MKRENKIKFFDNIFYWIWKYTLIGFPDRSFVFISVLQFIYVLLVISIGLILLDKETILWLCDLDLRISISPIIIVYIIIIIYNGKIYNEEKFQLLQNAFQNMNRKSVLRYRIIFFSFLVLTLCLLFVSIEFFIYYKEVLLKQYIGS